MDEVTHELVWKGYIMFGYNINTGRVQFADGYWGRAGHSKESLERNGWEVRPVHVELENK